MENKERLGSSGIGGQAVIEGIMMRNKDKYAVAVRKPDKSIDVDIQECGGIAKKYKITTLPFIRGIFSFIDSMVIGIKTLTYSASFFEDEDEQEEEPGKFEKWLLNKFGEKAEKVVMGFTVCLSIVIAVALFMILPDEKTTFYGLCSLFVNQVYTKLVEMADERGGRLKIRTNFILDEFG